MTFHARHQVGAGTVIPRAMSCLRSRGAQCHADEKAGYADADGVLEPVDEDAFGEGQDCGNGLVRRYRLVDGQDVVGGLERLLGTPKVSPAIVPMNTHTASGITRSGSGPGCLPAG